MRVDPALVEEPSGDDPLRLAPSPTTSAARQRAMSPVEAALNQAAQAYIEGRGTTGFARFFGGAAKADAAARTLQTLLPLQKEARAEETARMRAATDMMTEARQRLGEVTKSAEWFHGRSQQVQEDIREYLVENMTRLTGLDPAFVKKAYTTKGWAQQAQTLMVDDPLVTNEDRTLWTTWFKSATTDEDLTKLTDKATKIIDERAQRVVQRMAPKLADKYKLSPDTPIPAKEFLARLTKEFPTYATSPSLQRAIGATMKDADFMASLGVIPGAVTLAGQKKAAEVAAAGPSVDQGAKGVLAGQGIPLATATPEQIEAARTQSMKEEEVSRVRVAEATGLASTKATMAGRKEASLVQGMPLIELVIDKETKQPVDRVLTSLADIEKQGGEKRYALFDDKTATAYRAILESKALTSEWGKVIQGLATQPGQNFAIAVREKLKESFGVENTATAIDALRGSILRFAGAMQGSRVQLSNADRESVERLFPNILDSQATARQRLSTLVNIITAMEDVQLGKVTNADLSLVIGRAAPPVPKQVGAPRATGR